MEEPASPPDLAMDAWSCRSEVEDCDTGPGQAAAAGRALEYVYGRRLWPYSAARCNVLCDFSLRELEGKGVSTPPPADVTDWSQWRMSRRVPASGPLPTASTSRSVCMCVLYSNLCEGYDTEADDVN